VNKFEHGKEGQQNYERQPAALEKELETTKAEIQKPFAREAELEEKPVRLQQK